MLLLHSPLLQLAGFLSSELLAADVQAAAGEGDSEERQLRALARLASLPLAELGRQLVGAAQLEGAAAQSSAALSSRADVLHALRAVLEDTSRVEYRPPAQQGARAPPSMSRRAFQHAALKTVGGRGFVRATTELLERADLGDVLRLLSAGDGMPAELPAEVRPGS